MTQITRSMDVDASPERVWGLISDLASYTRWAKAVKAVTVVSRQNQGPSVRAHFLLEVRGQEIPVHMEVIEWATNKRLILATTHGLPLFKLSWSLELMGTRTRLNLTVDYDLPHALPHGRQLSGWGILDTIRAPQSWKRRIMESILRKGLDRGLEVLKDIAEGKQATSLTREWDY